ncbi:GH12 family glycosyl hydrolase domain-containing protein [Microbispora siamensis]|uniref:Glycosyl hydrolase family 12 n=1 Tax=Microbispora siamensis TaxID=564413 RepID=A0ABQ4GZD7_9ACTN|nr:hypothetical protein [Microbispora siamensis]GIH66819.1 hypothetical protein Msi02_76360 [Microbispora siamensis]
MWANHPNTGGVKSYPNVSRNVNRRLSTLGSVTSGFNVTVPSGGAYTTAYDIWCDGHTYEIMLWMNKYGPVGPLGSRQTSVSVGGHSWDVYRGSNGSNQVFSFVRQGNATSGTVDVKAVLNWLRTNKWFGDVTLGDVQFGYEITSSSGGMGLPHQRLLPLGELRPPADEGSSPSTNFRAPLHGLLGEVELAEFEVKLSSTPQGHREGATASRPLENRDGPLVVEQRFAEPPALVVDPVGEDENAAERPLVP